MAGTTPDSNVALSRPRRTHGCRRERFTLRAVRHGCLSGVFMKAAVIGAGVIAKQHLGCLREISRARGARSADRDAAGGIDLELAAVCDLSPAAAECAAERFGVARWFTDHRRMLDEIRPDVVHVTTPVPSHFPLALDALDAGAHVIVEKPATVNHEDLVALLERADARGRRLTEDYNYLFNSQVQAILSLIASGDFGQVIDVEVQICLDILAKGNGFVDPNAPHPILGMRGGAIAD